jgi:hypothetical protein
MLRMLALAVLLTAFSATSAHGGDKAQPASLWSSVADRTASPPLVSDPLTIDLRVPSALAWAQPSLRGAVSSGGKRRQSGAAVNSRQPAPARGGILGGLGRLASDSARAALAYPIGDRFSLDLGYRFLDVEDVIVRRGEPGTVDSTYSSHHLLFHARWRF